MAKSTHADQPLSSEQKIKEAARKVFMRKGYAATRTRDIAEEAGINLALLNYYFRSKEKLFQEVMAEKVQQLFEGLLPIANDAGTDLHTKISLLTSHYTHVISENPDLPFFVLYEIRHHADQFLSRIRGSRLLKDSVMFKQFAEASPRVSPNHFILNLFSLLIFPFVAQNLMRALLDLDETVMPALIHERLELVPRWMEMMMQKT